MAESSTKNGIVVVGGTPVWQRGSNLYIPSPFLRYFHELAAEFGPVTFFAAIPPTIPEGVETSEPLSSPLITVRRLRYMDAGPHAVRLARTVQDALAIAQAVRRARAVVHFFPAAGGPLGIAALGALSRAHLTYHKSDWIAFTRLQENRRLQVHYWNWCEKLDTWLADAIVCRSEVHLNRLGPRTSRREVAQPILAVASPDATPRERAAGEKLRILFVGRLLQEKGLLELLEAADVLRRAEGVPDFVVRLVGGCSAYTDRPDDDGPLPRWLSSRRSELHLEDIVEAAGHIDSPERLAAEYAHADIFVLPSWTEGFPRVIDEASSYGLPVVTTRVGGIPRVLTHDVDALLLPAKDSAALTAALQRLLVSAEERRRLGAGALASYRARIRETAAAQHIRLLRAVLQDSAAS